MNKCKTFLIKNILDTIFISGILILCYIIFFRHLGEFTIRIWDEGRNATNALEMLKNKNPVVTYFNGQPDMWNVKPPLHIWIVSIFFKIFGVSELSLRLPSAISSTLIVLVMYFFSLKILKNRWIGLLGSLIILSSMGFPDIHIGRSGDYDALLTMFTLLGSLLIFKYFQSWKPKYVYLAVLFFTMAVLAKGIAGLLIIPGIVLYALLSGNLIKIIKQKSFWLSLLLFVLIVGGYYLARELLNNGYVNAVWKEEIAGRYKKDIGSGGESFWYYWKLMASFRFQKWIYFLPISIIAVFFTRDKTIKRFIVFSFLLVITYFVIISKSETKQLWYDAQLYPLASLLVATFLVLLIQKTPFILKIFPILILCFYMQRYIRTNIAYIHRPDLDKSMSCIKYGYLFRDKSIDKSDFIGINRDVWCSPFQFYLEKNNLKTIKINEIVVENKILTCDGPTLDEIKQKHTIEIIFDNKDGCLGFKIKS